MNRFRGASPQLTREAPKVGKYRRGPQLRTTPAGTWFYGLDTDDRPSGLLLVFPGVDLKILLPTIERLTKLKLPGVLPAKPKLEVQAGRQWMIATAPPIPALSEVIDEGEHRTPGNAAALLADIARTLSTVHQNGLVHGSVTAKSVVIGPDGAGLLTDWATSKTATSAEDIAAWTKLAHSLAESWCTDLEAAAVLARAVGALTGSGWDAAIEQLRPLASEANRHSLVQVAEAHLAAPGQGARRRRPSREPVPPVPKRERRGPTVIPPDIDSWEPPPSTPPATPSATSPSGTSPSETGAPPLPPAPALDEPAAAAPTAPEPTAEPADPIVTRPATAPRPTAEPAEAPSSSQPPAIAPQPAAPAPNPSSAEAPPSAPSSYPRPAVAASTAPTAESSRPPVTDRSGSTTAQPSATPSSIPPPLPPAPPAPPAAQPPAASRTSATTPAQPTAPRRAGFPPTGAPSPTPSAPAPAPAPDTGQGTTGEKLRWPVVLAVLTIVALMGACTALLLPAIRSHGLSLGINEVTMQAQRNGTICTLVADIDTNGGDGTIMYRWTGDIAPEPVMTVSTAGGGERIQLGRQWIPADSPIGDPVLTLQILEPQPRRASAQPAAGCR
ncbi:hypothetical protein [Pseudonocardia spinosispora]|uniref:hypothetical protein n=1 Tax=Pseudonocardia spinosispora TaxID=103441 RepID=UPI00041C578E|nr:hypothetical protein [Pseudonocardia spinosispora]